MQPSTSTVPHRNWFVRSATRSARGQTPKVEASGRRRPILFGASCRSQRGRRHRRRDSAQSVGGPRLRMRAESGLGRRSDLGSVWMGVGVGHGGNDLERRHADECGNARIPQSVVDRVARSRSLSSSRASIPKGPFGAKECSEGSLAATIPAISNAIFDAVGVRLHESPFTPERVLAALRAKRNEKALNLTEGVIQRRRRIFASMADPFVSRAKARSAMRSIRRAARRPHPREVRIEPSAIQIAPARAVDEAVAFLSKHSSNIRVLAGGTDLIPSMRQKLFEPEYVLDLRGMAECAESGLKPAEQSKSERSPHLAQWNNRDICGSISPYSPKRR